jgi:hypothetical protein
MPDVVEVKNVYRRNTESWFSHSNHSDCHEELKKVGFFYLCNSSAALWPRNLPTKHVKLSTDTRSNGLREYRQVSLQFLLQQCWLLLLKCVRTISTEEKLDVISWLEKGERIFFTYAVMLDPLRVAYLHFVIMLEELQKVLSQELKCLLV